MLNLLIIKAVLIGLVWTFSWAVYFVSTYADTSAKNIGIALAPWILMLSYFLFFWWG